MALLLIQAAPNTTMLIVVALLMIAGWAATYIAAQRKLKRTVEGLRREMDERLSSLSSPKPQPPPVVIPFPQPASAPAEKHHEITAETLLVITAAVTAFLGKKVRIRSAQMLQTPYELFNPWAQQGRVFVQASHNLPQRGHRE